MSQVRYRRINFIGGPGVGKSTSARDLVSHMNKKGIKAEYIPEYVKQWAYEGKEVKGFDQTFLFANQLHAEEVLLREHSDIILVTDSPVLMNAWYGKKDNRPAWEQSVEIAHEFERQYPSVNIILKRCLDHRYDEVGRYQDLQGSMDIDASLQDFFEKAYREGKISTSIFIDSGLKPKHTLKRIYDFLFPQPKIREVSVNSIYGEACSGSYSDSGYSHSGYMSAVVGIVSGKTHAAGSNNFVSGSSRSSIIGSNENHVQGPVISSVDPNDSIVDVGHIGIDESEPVSSGVSINENDVIDINDIDVSSSPIFCEHANEMPAECPCGPNCYCKRNSCKPRVEKKKCNKCFGQGKIQDPRLEGVDSGDLHGCGFHVSCPNCNGEKYV